jgi:hypothetical protein
MEFRHSRSGFGQIHGITSTQVIFDGEAAISENSAYASVFTPLPFLLFLRPVA